MQNILIVTTSAARLGSSGEPTGLWIEELTTPCYAFIDAGAAVTVASVSGGRVPIDARSLKPKGGNEASVERYLNDAAFVERLADTPSLDGLSPEGFDALFLPGGHGTMTDFPENAALAGLVSAFDAAGKLIAAVCHGPAGLVGATRADGAPLVEGRRVTGFSDSEERAVGLDQVVPFLLETRLRELGARYEAGPDFAPFTLRDGNLVTGQNPASAGPAAELVLGVLRDTGAAAGRAGKAPAFSAP
ncbi:MAG: type 1 glutamine amidotransferase domain-containing protein [Rhodobacteraceae bacterium]|nr:type 1 glutamine amidotransferase domain-containing protein [Paracoccaceae bacterium]